MDIFIWKSPLSVSLGAPLKLWRLHRSTTQWRRLIHLGHENVAASRSVTEDELLLVEFAEGGGVLARSAPSRRRRGRRHRRRRPGHEHHMTSAHDLAQL